MNDWIEHDGKQTPDLLPQDKVDVEYRRGTIECGYNFGLYRRWHKGLASDYDIVAYHVHSTASQQQSGE